MGVVRKEIKDEIVKMMLDETPTEEIANKLHLSVSTVRKVFEELREEYGVNSKTGIAVAYLRDIINEHLTPLMNIAGGSQITILPKGSQNQNKRQKSYKNKKFKK